MPDDSSAAPPQAHAVSGDTAGSAAQSPDGDPRLLCGPPPDEGRSGPVRTCAGCRRRDVQARLVRMVADGAGRLKIDGLRREVGRGAWVHATRGCVEALLQKDALGKAFRRRVMLPPGVDTAVLLARVVEAATRKIRKSSRGNKES